MKLSAPFPPPTTVQAGSDLDDASDHFPDGSGGEDKEYFDRPGTSRPALCAYNAMTADLISPDDVKSMDTPTTDFLCDQRANTCGIDFSYFSQGGCAGRDLGYRGARFQSPDFSPPQAKTFFEERILRKF